MLWWLGFAAGLVLRNDASPRSLFATLQRSQPQLHPDGHTVAYLCPNIKGVLNVALAPVPNPLDRKLCTRSAQPVRSFAFAGQSVVFEHDVDGDERFVLEAVDLDSRAGGAEQACLKAREVGRDVAQWWPAGNKVLVAEPADNPQVVAVDLRTGERTVVAANPGGAIAYAVDDGAVVAALVSQDGQKSVLLRTNGTWSPAIAAAEGEELNLVGGHAGEAFVTTNAGTDLVGLEAAGPSGRRVLFRGTAADVASVDLDGAPVAVSSGVLTPELTPLAHESEFAFLQQHEGWPWVLSRARNPRFARADKRLWVVAYSHASRPTEYVLADLDANSTSKLFDEIPWHTKGFASFPFYVESEEHQLPSYLTFPVPDGPTAWPKGQWPLVLLVHGGPWARDGAAFDPMVHWLASQGYLVLRVNFRGSRGFGRAFLERGDGEWGGGMLRDMVAGVAQVERAGVMTGAAVMGESFGGYATLGLLTLPAGAGSPFRCGVDMFGPADLTTLASELPAKYNSASSWLADRLGSDLAAASPVGAASSLRAPVLIAQGSLDPRVRKEQSEAFVRAAPKGLVTYVPFDREGHGLLREDNRIAFLEKAQGFLRTCLQAKEDES